MLLYSICYAACLALTGYTVLVLLIAVHEFGHWLAAVICGFCRLEVRFSIIRWRRAKGWGFVWSWGSLLTGITNVHITRAERWVRLRYLLFSVSGSFASIALAFGLILLSGRLRGILADVLALCAAGSGLLGISSLIPSKLKSRRTDGRRMLDALFNLEDMERIRFGARLHDESPSLRALYQASAWTELMPKATRYLDESRRWSLDGRAVKALEEMVSASQAGLSAESLDAKTQ